jgi:hypothetical protein
MQNIRIHWIQKHPEKDIWLANVPSLRLRLGAALTHPNLVITYSNNLKLKEVDFVVISKMMYASQGEEVKLNRVIELSKQISKAGKKIIVDYTDNYLEKTKEDGSLAVQFVDKINHKFYKDLISIADAVVVSSKKLETYINEFTNKPTFLIPDAVDDFPEIPPIIDQPLEYGLFYGSDATFKFLLRELPHISSQLKKSIELYCLVSVFTYQKYKDSTRSSDAYKNITLDLLPWSLQAVVAKAQKSSFVCLPGGQETTRKSFVSENRLITAFALNRPALASPLDSYTAFSPYFLDLSREKYDLSEEIENYPQNTIRLAKDIAKSFSKNSIGELWHDMFKKLL